MPAVAKLNSRIVGTTGGEHSGHDPAHGPLPISGYIDGNCSSNVFVNNLPAAFIGSTTAEFDGCCGASSGAVGQGSPNVFVNGIPVSRDGDAVNVHSGTGNIVCSGNVFANGG